MSRPDHNPNPSFAHVPQITREAVTAALLAPHQHMNEHMMAAAFHIRKADLHMGFAEPALGIPPAEFGQMALEIPRSRECCVESQAVANAALNPMSNFLDGSGVVAATLVDVGAGLEHDLDTGVACGQEP